MEQLEDFALSVTNFLEEYKWIYNFKMTEILDHSLPYEINDINFEDLQDPVHNKCIQRFFTTCRELTKTGESFLKVNEVSPSSEDRLPRKWSRKKYLEVLHFEQFLINMCEDKEDITVVDIGSGLGYLSSKLSSSFKEVLAIEEKSSNISTSQSLNTSINLVHINLKLTNINMAAELENLLQNKKTALIGLHSCGDLTPNSIKTFVNSSNYKYLALVSCCYHKMDTSNFPMSQSFGKIQYNTFFLRLACQKRGNLFLTDKDSEVNSVLFRAILQLLRNDQAKDNKFHAPKTCKDFPSYVDELIANGSCKESDRETLALLYNQNSSKKSLIFAILTLQGRIQRLCELCVLVDRLCYLLEKGLNAVLFSRVIPESVTPRGCVLYCNKMSTHTDKK